MWRGFSGFRLGFVALLLKLTLKILNIKIYVLVLQTLPIRNRMREPDRFVSKFGVLNTSMVITICLCLTIGFFGYLRFGDDILGSITYNIPNSPP